jgi:hypothetical protein
MTSLWYLRRDKAGAYLAARSVDNDDVCEAEVELV